MRRPRTAMNTSSANNAHTSKLLWIASLLIAYGCGYLQSRSFASLSPSLGSLSRRNDGTETTASSNITLEYAVTSCSPITEAQQKALQHEINDYQRSTKFRSKIQEVQGQQPVAAHHVAIDAYLRRHSLVNGSRSVLELGCAAGQMLQMVQQQLGEGAAEFFGVELVPGWVEFAESYHKNMHIFQGDMTDFILPDPFADKTFDFVMLNDVAEHVQKERYGCLFQQLRRVTHAGSIIYVHTPTPQAQLADSGQYLENVLPHHFFVTGMALAGFELVTFEHDLDTDCGRSIESLDTTVRQLIPPMLHGTKCFYNGYTKYYHAVFRLVDDSQHSVFDLA